MAFLEEVTNTSFTDFITALRSFAVTVGFTNNSLSSDNFSFGYNTDTSFWAFNPTASTLIEGKLARGLAGGSLYDAQPGTQVSVSCKVDELAASYVKFLLFGDAPSSSQAYVHAIIEVTAGVFKHLHFGVLDKFGTWGGGASSPGGEYMVGHSTIGSAGGHSMPWSAEDQASSNDQLNVDDSRIGTVTSTNIMENKFGTTNSMTIFRKTADVQFGKNGAGWFEDLYHLGQCSFSGINPMFPILVMGRDEGVFRTIFSDNFPLGQVPDMRFVSMDGLSPGDKITAGGSDWHVFPVWDKGLTKDTTDGEDTGFAGFAFREIP